MEKANDTQEWKDSEKLTRELASKIVAFSEIKPHTIWVWYAIPRKKRLKEVSQCLIGLSNSFFEADEYKTDCLKTTHKLVEEIRRLMKIAK